VGEEFPACEYEPGSLFSSTQGPFTGEIMARLAKWGWPLLAGVVLVFVILVGTRNRKVLIGFTGCLSGRSASLGIDGRDGAMLAVMQANARGGVDGHQLKLMVRDNGLDPEKAVAAVNSLISAGVSALVGPMTSSMAMAILPQINASQLPTVAPTASTNELSGRDDWFFRVYNTGSADAAILADYMYNHLEHGNACVLYDMANRAHTESWYLAFARAFEALGGVKPYRITFSSRGRKPDYTAIAAQVGVRCPDCLVILANSLDTAMFMQQLTRMGSRPDHIIASEWSATEDVIALGGRTVEGMIFFRSYDPEFKGERFSRFKEEFRATFGREPGFAAVQAYDAANVVIEALASGRNPVDIKARLLSSQGFPGLQSRIVFDRYGDIHRPHLMMTIRDGRFQPLREAKP